MDHRTVARLYLTRSHDDQLVVNLPGTSYQIHLRAASAVRPTAQGRLRGVIRCPVWKLDRVSPGGAFIEPVFGRPRRVQGRVIDAVHGVNSIIIDVSGTPIVADLPERYSAAGVAPGTLVGLDIKQGATFEPAEQPAAA